MTSFTFDTLKTALQAYTEDTGDDFVNNLDTIISNGFEMVIRDLDLEIFKRNATGSFTQNSNVVNRESDMLSMQSFYYIDSNDGNKRKQILPRDYDFCINYWPTLTDTGNPKYYCEYSETQFFVVKTPNAAYNYEQRILIRPLFSSTNQTTWLATHAGDLLLYACLMQSEKFLMSKGDGRVQEWKEEYSAMLPRAREELQTMQRHDFAPLQSNSKVEATV